MTRQFLWCLGALCFLAVFISPLQEDIRLSQLSSGKFIWQQHSFLEFTSTLLEGSVYRNLFWLENLISYALAQLDMRLLWILPIFSMAISWAFICRKASIWTSLTILLFLIVGNFHFPFSSHYLIPLFSTLLLTTLYSSNLFCLLPLIIVWANTHPSFVFALLSIAVFWFAKKILCGEETDFSFIWVVLCVFCCLISPWGYHTIIQAIKYSYLSNALLEPSLSQIAIVLGYFWFFIVTLWLLASIPWQNFILPEVLLAITWLFFGIFYQNWMIAVTVFLSFFLVRYPPAIDLVFPKKMIACGRALLLLALTTVVISTVTKKQLLSFTPIDANKLPITAANFVKKLPGPVKIYNDPDIGGSLSWISGKKTYLDSRVGRFTSFQLRDAHRIRFDFNYFKKIMERLNITLAIIDYSRIFSEEFFIEYSYSDKTWEIIYCDHLVAIFAKKSALPKSYFDKLALLSTKNLRHLYARGSALAYMGEVQAQKDLEYVISHSSKDALYYMAKGRLHSIYGETQQAINNWQKALALLPRLEIFQLLIKNYIDQGDLKSGRKSIEKALSLYPQDLKIKFYHAKLLRHLKDPSTARSILREILRLEPRYKAANDLLSNVEKEAQKQNIMNVKDQVKELIDQEKYQEALKLLEKLDDFVSFVLRGIIANKLGDKEQAIKSFIKALRQAPQNIEANCHLALTLAEDGQWRAGFATLNKLLQNRGAARVPKVQETLEEIEKIAVKDLKKKIKQEKDPKKNYGNRKLLVKIYVRQKHYKKAIELLGKDFLPEDSELVARLYFSQGQNLINQSKVASGIKLLKKAIEIFPRYLEVHLMLATIALKRKKWKEASKYFNSAKKLAPANLKVINGLALIELGRGLSQAAEDKWLEALQAFERFVHLVPGQEEKKYKQQMMKNINRFLIKKEELEQIAKLKQLKHEAGTAAGNKNWKEAIRLCLQHNKIKAKDPDVYRYLALAYRYNKEPKQAIAAMQKAIALAPKSPILHEELARIYDTQQKYEAALEHWRTCLKHMPKKTKDQKEFAKSVQKRIKWLEKFVGKN